MTVTDHLQKRKREMGRGGYPKQKKKLGGLANLQTSPWCRHL